MLESNHRWVPKSPREEIDGFVWLPRLLDKARQTMKAGPGEFLALEASFLDRAFLRRWQVSGDQIREWLTEGRSDEAISREIGARACATKAEKHRWSQRFLTVYRVIFDLMDVDEGRPLPMSWPRLYLLALKANVGTFNAALGAAPVVRKTAAATGGVLIAMLVWRWATARRQG